MKIEAGRQPAPRPNFALLIGTFLLAVTAFALPLYSVGSASVSRATEGLRKVTGTEASVVAGRRANLPLPAPTTSPEIIQTYDAECANPKTTFVLGEVVCAKVSFVTENNRFVNWLQPPGSTVAFSSPTIPDNQTHNYLYTPTVTGGWKATIADPSDSSIIPTEFEVIDAGVTLATYASNCTTAKSSFNLGEGVCIKVSGLSGDEFPLRRVQLSTPDGFAVERLDVTDNSVQLSYTLPAGLTQSIGGVTVNNIGTWAVSLIDPDANIVKRLAISVSKSNLLADRFADLQVVKSFLPEINPPTAGSDITFQVIIFNAGPNPATNPTLADLTLANTTFRSFTRNTVLASNELPNQEFLFGGYNSFMSSGFNKSMRNLDTIEGAFDRSYSPIAFEDTPLTFNCVSPSEGAAGTTNCSASGELAPGETATFTVVYRINTNVPNGFELSDQDSVNVGSDTGDQFPSSNTHPAESATTVVTSNPNPPACTLTCPDNITVGTNAVDGGNNPGATVSFAPEAFGTCGSGMTSAPASGTFFPVGTTPVTTTTGSGASCNFNVTVVNTPQPTISCAADQTAAAASGQSSASVSVTPPSFTGSGAILSSSRSDQGAIGDPYPVGTTEITWTATDQYGTMATCTQRVIVTSADAATISCPANKTYTATAGCERTLSSAEIGTPTVGGVGTTYEGVRSDHLALTDPFPAGQTAITWTATNSLGNASCVQIITINTTGGTDVTAPTLNIPADISLSTSECAVLLDDELGVATADDDCTNAVTISRTGLPQIACPIPGNPGRTCDSFYFPTGTTNITYTATDAAGNSTTLVQHVTIAESPATPPTITAPNDVTMDTLATDASCGTYIGDATLGSAVAADNCPGVTVTRSGVPAGNIFPVGPTTVTYTATDRTGQTATDTQVITVNDKTPPAISCPANITVYLPLNSTATSMPVTYPAATASDNCGGTTIGYSIASGSTFSVGETTVTATATDTHSNTASCTFTITVLYNFTGFFSPVNNPPTLNSVNAGRAIPLKFSLSGNKGLSIFASGYPLSQQIACDTSAPLSDVEGTVTSGGSTLTYSPDQYHYSWKTESSWAGTCRVLVVKLNDGSTHTALFKFK
ncbi:MAG TPA: PxKF domain-containing protein [Pyrinomonadaceae bacterium]|nr:PxKF domain-containing protein [Pyrinomonadaceae bacterium]